MTKKRFSWIWLLLMLIVGFGVGLAYAWVISPVQYVDAEPIALRDDFKDHFRSAIAAAYASNEDLERARARLVLLGDTNPSQALTAQAQRMLAIGESPESIQKVARLAAALQGLATSVSSTEVVLIPTNDSQLSSQPINTVNATAPAETVQPESTPASTAEEINTPIPELTITPRPTRTATPTLGAPYQLVGQDTVCDAELAEGLMQIIVTTITRNQLPGQEIIITWGNSEEHVFTGLKPELGNGYADFLMTPNVTYSVRMADGGTPASDLSAPDCTDKNGNPYPGGVRITFQQP